MNLPRPVPARDLTDAEFVELDELLTATPEPLDPVDAVMLDGYLCGVLVQPELIDEADWLPPVFDFDGQPLPDDVDPTWHERVLSLVRRRHAALRRAIEEDGWFDPLVLELDEDAEAEPPEAAGDAASDAASGQDDGFSAAYAQLSPISQSLMPWVAGFHHAVQSFPALGDLPDDAVQVALARLYRHLPAADGEAGQAEREIQATLDREHPLRSLDAAMEDLVVTVADLCDLTRDARYRVEQVQRETPKLGRNDPCHCGSGRKFKVCHGA